MILRPSELDLRLLHPFTISRGSRVVQNNVAVTFTHNGLTGLGEAAPIERYGETQLTVIDFLCRTDLSRFEDPLQIDRILPSLNEIAEKNYSAKAAVDIALHDWMGKKLGVPLWRLWGLNKGSARSTSFTIGIDEPGVVRQKVIEAAYYPFLKVKMGVPGDEQFFTLVRSLTDKPIRVDANEGWNSRDEALEKILWLERQQVELIEQPLPAEDLDGTAWLRERVNIPIIADESVMTSADIPRLQYVFDGINIKLMKCGGLHEAMRMVYAAKVLNMKTMLGCMIESSIAISAAAQLSPLVDYLDLDGSALLAEDPFFGVQFSDGKVLLGDLPGIGAIPR